MQCNTSTSNYNELSSKLQCLPSTVSEVPALRTSAAFAPHSLKLVEEWRFVLRTAGIDLCLPSTRTEFGKRSFRVAAPRTWNSLPLHLLSPTISRQQFQSGLKTHLFKRAYIWLLPPRTIEEWTYFYLLTYCWENLPQWLSWLRHSAHRPGRSIREVGVQFPGSAVRFRVRISGAHVLRLISWAGKEGSTVSSIICDRWLILS